MSTQHTITGTSIELRRRVPAPRVRVFDAFVDPAQLRRWYAPVATWTVSEAVVDARPGGAYRLVFGPPGEDGIVETGTYVEVEPPRRLVIDVHVGGSETDERTRVTIELIDHGDETEIVVVEGEYSSEAIARRHAGGWTTMLERLAAVVAG